MTRRLSLCWSACQQGSAYRGGAPCLAHLTLHQYKALPLRLSSNLSNASSDLPDVIKFCQLHVANRQIPG